MPVKAFKASQLRVLAVEFAYLLTAKATMVAKPHGGAQSSKVIVGEYPSVSVRVGKNALNDSETTRPVSASANQ